MSKEKRKELIPSRPRCFEEFWEQAIIKDGLNANFKYVTSRNDWLKESKTENVIDKISADELEEAEELGKKSQLGSYIDSATILDVYGDDLGVVVDNMKDKGILVYYWNSETTIWQKKEGGLVRIK